MDNVKTVDDLIKEKKLTQEELELFKDLIQETKDREEKIAQVSKENRQNLKRLSEVMTIISGHVAILDKLLTQTLDEMESNYLRSLPADIFCLE